MTEEQIKEQKFEELFDIGKVFFRWQIPEYAEHKRSIFWYLGMTLLAIILIIYSIKTANFLFALIIILTIFIVFLRSYYPPRKINFLISEDGILVGNAFYPYNEIKKFYIIYKPPVVKKLYFDLKGIRPTLSIPLYDKNPLVIRERLLKYLQEDLDKENQTLDDQLETILKL